MISIYKREMLSFFYSPIGYLFIAVFYFFSGYYFVGYTVMSNTTDLSGVFGNMFSICIFAIPVLTMKLVSEEKRNKTDQLLLTSPISLVALVFGKYLAALTVYVIATIQTLIFAIIVDVYSTANWAVVLGNYAGIFLLGVSLIAIGIFISALTENQFIAAVISFAVGLMLMFMDSFAYLVQSNFMRSVFNSLSFNAHYTKFTQGMLNLPDIVFFLSIAAVFLFLTVRVFEHRRWQ